MAAAGPRGTSCHQLYVGEYARPMPGAGELIVEMVQSRCDFAPKELAEETRRDASPPTLPAALLIERSRDARFELSAQRWEYLDENELKWRQF